ncbi:pyruvate dehydrogenase complex dihydrolipoamide acetyltransferase [Fulvivirga sp. RKSG066]|uniref:pyruvate dehydrogenase complex dihydrolipoamide acetyltransferase n=1 Tax=Fulvivirga aurantia TaxID=2529383 RepID=UPI0012BD607C|nr:pyruvate dehydrogenase complex dihydrolipoamide acetyltransferase [Fulvivirga aurantia]MTI21614.1 pyruvate dehydrogenase complex dihydrolipoamide acetyltransferase [Fulvivirga aurantia]
MAEVIKMPKMSDTMEEGVIASWLVKEGDKIKSGDILAEVETDKATMELESYEDGVLLHIGVKEKEAVPVDGVIAIIGEEGEDIKGLLKELEEGGSSDNGESKDDEADDKSEKSEKSEEATEDIDTSDINATIITMPKMSDTMTEGTIASWQKKEGDKISSGDIMAEVETDKATMELEAYEDGTLLYIGVKEGESVEVDGVLAIVGEEGADYEKLLKAHKAKASKDESSDSGKEEKKEDKSSEKKSTEQKTESKDSSAQKATQDTSTADGRIKASPLAKKMASDKGYDLSKIPGSGDNGRIVKKDVENYTPAKEVVQQAAKEEGSTFNIPQVVGEESYEEQNVSQMRKTIAKRLAESKFTAPHFYLTMEINMDKAMEARASMNEYSPVKISFNDIAIKAVAAALRQHPKVNSSWLGDKIRYNKHVHIGVAVAVDEGLLVPVVRFADSKNLSHISAEVKQLAKKATSKELQPHEWEGNTFTISNLGMFGIEEFTAIINPPDSCILAVGGIKQTAVVKDGQLVPGNVMKVTLSCDHRVVDGALGAAFLQTLKGLLENPVRILV